jgi:hypothetical protein
MTETLARLGWLEGLAPSLIRDASARGKLSP